MTQAQQLIDAIRRKPSGMTYGQLQDLHVSTSPHKRLAESGERHLHPGEKLVRVAGRDGLVRFKVVKA